MALKHLVFMSLQENFKSLDKAFQLKISISELMIRFELTDFEFVENRINQIKRDFKSLLNEKLYERERELIRIIVVMLNSDSIKADKVLRKRVDSFLQLQPSSSDSDIINYNTWIKEKSSL